MIERALPIIATLMMSLIAHGQLVLDGDLDDLPSGDLPNDGEPNGAWGCSLCAQGLCEDSPDQFTTVPTSDFEPGATGNSLRMRITPSDIWRALPNVFTRELLESTDPNVVIVFDIWVAENGVYSNVVIGGPNDPPNTCGLFADTDRAIQIGWHASGMMSIPNLDPNFGCPTVLVAGYPVAAWQTVRVELDLVADTYDLWWAQRGDPLQLLADGIDFASTYWAGSDITLIDRFWATKFPDVAKGCGSSASAHTYFDNLSASTCLADLDTDGAVGINDLLQLLAAWGPCATPCVEDIDENGVVGITDLLELLASWGDCS